MLPSGAEIGKRYSVGAEASWMTVSARAIWPVRWWAKETLGCWAA